MQRMEELQEAEESAALAAARASAAGPAGGDGSTAAPARRRSSGFKPGFLLGKQLEPKAPRSAAAAHGQQGQGQAAAAGPGEAGAQQQRRELEEAEAEAASRREAAFTGRVVERTAPASSGGLPQGELGGHGQPEQEEPPQEQRVSRFKLQRQGY